MALNSEIDKKIISYDEYPYLTYGRVSTEKDEQISSLENQIDICRNWLERNNFEWNENSVVIDNGISGTILLDREAMQLVLEKAKRREIKMVIFKSINRLARDLKDSLEIKEILIAHGVRLVTIEEDYDSLYEGKNEMKFEMHSMFAAQYPKTLSVSISGALAAKLRRGENIGPVPFGYSLKDKKLVINEQEAPTVRQIFKWYNEDGYGYKTITSLLNEEMEKGNVAPPRKSSKWQLTTVQRIIKNPKYAGYFVHNRYAQIKIGGRKKNIENPREKWIIYENHHPGIITKEEWEKANSKHIPNKRTKITPWNEFRSLLTCGKCGSNMVILQSYKYKKDGTKTKWRYLKCSAYRRGGKDLCVNHTPILYEDFRDFILEELRQKGRNIKLNLIDKTQEIKEKEITHLEKTMKSLKAKHEGLIDMYLEDRLITKHEFQKKRKEYEIKIKDIENRIFLLKKDHNIKKEIKKVGDAFKELNKENADLHDALKTIIDHIVIYPDGKVNIYYNFSI